MGWLEAFAYLLAVRSRVKIRNAANCIFLVSVSVRLEQRLQRPRLA